MMWDGNYLEAQETVQLALAAYGELLRTTHIEPPDISEICTRNYERACSAFKYIINCNALAWGRIQELRDLLNLEGDR